MQGAVFGQDADYGVQDKWIVLAIIIPARVP